MYQGLLTAIVRVQAGRQQITDAEAFRRKRMSALQDVEREAIAAGYDNNDIKDTHFAVVAFLDYVILNSTQPIRTRLGAPAASGRTVRARPCRRRVFRQAELPGGTPGHTETCGRFRGVSALSVAGISGALLRKPAAVRQTASRKRQAPYRAYSGFRAGVVPRCCGTSGGTRCAETASFGRRLIYAVAGALIFTLVLFILLRLSLEWTHRKSERC